MGRPEGKQAEASRSAFRWPAKETRVLLLNVAFLLGLMWTQVVFTNRYANPNIWLRIFGWLVFGFSFVVLFVGVRWLFLARRTARQAVAAAAAAATAAALAVREEPEPEPPPPRPAPVAAAPPTPASALMAVRPDSADPLTGLPNWKGILAELNKPMYEAKSDTQHTRLVYMELLGLPSINYEHGRTVGDMVLQKVAGLLQAKKPAGAAVGRPGGPEFVVIVPMATAEEAEQLAGTLKQAVMGFTFDLGSWGKVKNMGARTCVVPYAHGETSPQKALDSVRSIGRPVESSEIAGDAGVRRFYHLPQVTLEAFAVHSWDDLPKGQQTLFKAWRWDPTKDFVQVMVSDLLHLLEVRVQKSNFAFVTVPPFPPAMDHREQQAALALGKKLAEQLGVPFRKVLKTAVLGPSDSHQVHAQLDTTVEKGSGVVIVQDVVTSPRLLRRSVRELSAAGCHVLVLAWAVQMSSEDALQALR